MSEPLLNAEAQSNEKQNDDDKFAIADAAGIVQLCCEANKSPDDVYFYDFFFMDRGIHQDQVGKAYFCLSAGFLISYPLSRWLLNRFAANKIQFYSSFLFIATRYICATFVFVPDEYLLACLSFFAFFMGMVASVIESAGSTWVMLSVEPVDRVKAMGRLTERRVSGNILAPAVGGTLYAIGGFSLPFLVGATLHAMYMISARKKLLSSTVRKTAGGDKTNWLCLAVPDLQTRNADTSRRNGLHVCCTGVAESILTLQLSSAFLCNRHHQLPFVHSLHLRSEIASLVEPEAWIFRRLTNWCFIVCFWQFIVGSFSIICGNTSTAISDERLASNYIYLPLQHLFGMFLTVIQPMCTNAAILDGFPEHEAAAQIGSLVITIAGASIGVGPALAGPVVEHYGVGYWCTFVTVVYLLVISPLVLSIKTLDAKNPFSVTCELPSQNLPSDRRA
eukprot:CAMPEP_0169191150 /NCGR_PEP_ID=MMETSP1016-20121227/4917_1 /TAXON_ID=342587 /ORGANISM="Karlodinium micrum, Strain CCMP2283" /LENGTH=447 /DNA_ID=CAMNT_0009267383 /DNA_START=50 /DNA_END=1392 /DNA_ORIENTATION=-